MKGSEAVFGYEVTYKSSDDGFTTHQVHRPVDGRFYLAQEVKPVVFKARRGWLLDASDPYVPVAIGPNGQRVPLNKAIHQDHVHILNRWERPIQQEASAATA